MSCPAGFVFRLGTLCQKSARLVCYLKTKDWMLQSLLQNTLYYVVSRQVTEDNGLFSRCCCYCCSRRGGLGTESVLVTLLEHQQRTSFAAIILFDVSFPALEGPAPKCERGCADDSDCDAAAPSCHDCRCAPAPCPGPGGSGDEHGTLRRHEDNADVATKTCDEGYLLGNSKGGKKTHKKFVLKLCETHCYVNYRREKRGAALRSQHPHHPTLGGDRIIILILIL